MSSNTRNTWKTNCKNPRCIKCIASWTKKANTHAFNAARTKYALQCFLEGNTQSTPTPGDGVEPVALDDNPVFTGTLEDMAKQKKNNELFMCGICSEKMVKVGTKKPIIYGCGHTNCAECYNGMILSGRSMACPYCRTDITKAVRLFVN